MILQKIIEDKKRQVDLSKKNMPVSNLIGLISKQPAPLDFLSAFNNSDIKLIAEVKQASPSKGIICQNFEIEKIVSTYIECNVAAISVLTEEKYFRGKLDYLKTARYITDKNIMPLLRKDFIFDNYQVYESRAYGADAILLIVNILTENKLKELIQLTRELGMECLIEVHNEREIDIALRCDAKIIGINNRDLNTFKTDISTTLRLSKLIPSGIIIVSESGINNHDDIVLLKQSGINAVLIGEALVSAKNIKLKIRELMGW